MVTRQGRNKVYGIRDQLQKMGWDLGSQHRDLGGKPWDGDQHYCKEIRDSVVRHNNKDHNILKCALLEEPSNIFQFSCIFAVTFRSGTKLF